MNGCMEDGYVGGRRMEDGGKIWMQHGMHLAAVQGSGCTSAVCSAVSGLLGGYWSTRAVVE